MMDQSDINNLQDSETEAISYDFSPSFHSDSSNQIGENEEPNIENTASGNLEYDSKDIASTNLPVFPNTIELGREIKSIVKMTVDSITSIVAFAMQVKKALDDYREPLRHLYESSITFFDGVKSIALGFRNYLEILESLKSNQITVWFNVDFYFSEDVPRSDQVNSLLLKYYISNENDKLKKLINDCRFNCRCATTSILISQAEVALFRSDYHLAAIGFTAILDGILSEVSEDTAHIVAGRLVKIEKKWMESESHIVLSDDINDYSLYCTIFDVIKLFTKSAPFDEAEPTLLNRHWLMHGRTTREYSLVDCIKILSMIYGMLLVGKLIETGKNTSVVMLAE